MNIRKFIGTVVIICFAGLVHVQAQTNLTQQILRMRTFREGLALTGTNQPSDAENRELIELLTHLREPWWTTGLEQFFRDYPDSPWAASLHYDYASFCRRTGRTTKALENYEAAWDLVKNETDPQSQRLGGAILGNWTDLLSSLGRLEKLKELVAIGNGRRFVNPYDRDLFEGAKNAYYLMRDHPGIAYRCGTFALKAVGEELEPTNRALESLVEVPSPTNGFSMASLMDLAKKYGLNLEAVRRTAGQKLIVPSVVHWRQNHYAAILQQRGDLYLVNDPTFTESQWIPADVINEEASGEFLVPAKAKPHGWSLLARNETEKIHGMGLKNSINNAKDCCCVRSFSGQMVCTCPHTKGMPVWWVSEPYIDLWLQDEPLSYLTSKGEPFSFQLSFKQRDTRQVAVTTDEFLQKNWNNSWFSYIALVGSQDCDPLDDSSCAVAVPWSSAVLYLPNGGAVDFSQSTYDPATRLQLQSRFGAVGTDPSKGSSGLQVVHADGSIDIYGAVDGGTDISGEIPQNDCLLTQHIDPHGNATWFIYGATNGNNVLQQVIDYNGLTNNLIYNSSGLLLEVVNPYGQTAKFTYDSNANLIKITDAQGLFSTISYDTNGYPTALTTPYGTTTFSLADNGISYEGGVMGNAGGDIPGLIDRSALVVDPTGATNLYMYRYDADTVMASNSFASNVPTSTPLGTLDTGLGTNAGANSAAWFRNSFYWGPMQYSRLSTRNITNFTEDDYLLARMQHWLQDTNELYVTDYLSVERDPSPDGANPGLTTFYDYQGKAVTDQEGTNALPSVRAWQLADGSTHYDYLNFGDFGNIASWASTYSLPNGGIGTRTNQFIYAENTYSTTIGSWDGSGLINTVSESYSVPNLLTEVIGADGSAIWSYGGFDTISTTNFFIDLDPPNDQTNAIITTWSRVLPDHATNGLGQVASFSYMPASQGAVAVFDYTNFATTNSINPANNWPGMDEIASYTSATGLTTTNVYDTNGFLVQTIDEQIGRTNSFTYQEDGLLNTWTNELGLGLDLQWDNLLRLVEVDFPDGTYDFIKYDSSHTPLDPYYIIDRIGNRTSFGYDGDRHLTAINRPNGTTLYDWCGCGALTAEIDALQNRTALNYDNQGIVTNVSYPDNTSLAYHYDSAERMTNVSDALGRSLTIGYNNQGLVTTVSNANGLLESVVYDIKDRPVQIADANGVIVTNSYDVMDELLSRTWPDGISEHYGYNAAGLIAYTNRDGQATQYGLDAAGRLVAVTNANKEVVQLAYNPSGEVVALTNGLNQLTKWQYDENGLLTNKTDALGRDVLQLAYNPDGWVINRWTPEKGNTVYNYDGVGNVLSVVYPNFTNSYAYDADNELTNMSDQVGTSAFSYTQVGQLASETGPWSNDVVAYLYSQQLRTNLTLSEPGSSWSQAYNYDLGWRMTGVSSPAGTFGYSYNFQPASSLISGITLPNGAGIGNGYDSLARLTQTILTNHWGHALDGYTYTLDPLGLRTNILRNLGLAGSSVSVGYDNIGQLTQWSAKETNGLSRFNEQLAFGFDAADNLHFRTNGALSQTFTVDGANELTNVSRAGAFTFSGATPAPATNITVNGQIAQAYGDFTFAATNLSLANGNNNFTSIARNVYGVVVTNTFTVNLPSPVTLNFDNNGNLTNDGTRVFGYNTESQLTNVFVPGQFRSDFVYDGLGRRRIVREYAPNGGGWVETNEIHIIYDGYLPIQERDTNNNILATYTRGLDLSSTLQGVGGIGGLLARTDTNGSTFYHSDGAGNVTGLMDGQEDMVARYMYGPFGKLVGQWGSMAGANEMQFSSMPRDTLSGLSFYPFRAYEPNFQRWVNLDPVQEAGGINLYRFNFNNPLRWVDPRGFGGAGEDGEEGPGETFEDREQQADDDLLKMFSQDQFPAAPRDEAFEPVPPPPGPQMTPEEFAQRTSELEDEFNKAVNKPKPPSAAKVPCPTKGGVYGLTDPENGKMMRVGQTKDLARRAGEYGRDPDYEGFVFNPLYYTDNYAERRGLEQMAFVQFESPPLNINNPIGPNNQNYPIYMKAAQQYLDNQK